MFTSCGSLFCNGRDSLSTLYSELSTLNNQIVRGQIVLSLEDLKTTNDRARKFLSQYLDKNGPMYDQVMADEKGTHATRIRALATNIGAIMSQQAKLNELSKTATSRSSIL